MRKILTAAGATAMIAAFDAAFETINKSFGQSMLSVSINRERRFWAINDVVSKMERDGWTIQDSAWGVVNRER